MNLREDGKTIENDHIGDVRRSPGELRRPSCKLAARSLHPRLQHRSGTLTSTWTAWLLREENNTDVFTMLWSEVCSLAVFEASSRYHASAITSHDSPTQCRLLANIGQWRTRNGIGPHSTPTCMFDTSDGRSDAVSSKASSGAGARLRYRPSGPADHVSTVAGASAVKVKT